MNGARLARCARRVVVRVVRLHTAGLDMRHEHRGVGFFFMHGGEGFVRVRILAGAGTMPVPKRWPPPAPSFTLDEPAPRLHRAAEWSIRGPGDFALGVLAEEGYVCDASMTRVPPLGDARNHPGPQSIGVQGGKGRIVELPPLTGRGFGRNIPMGGGWPFRMFSADRVARTEAAFRDSGWPAVFTFHPWELDPAHPPMEGISPIARLVHFYRLGSTLDLLRRWLDPADPCAPVGDAIARLAA